MASNGLRDRTSMGFPSVCYYRRLTRFRRDAARWEQTNFRRPVRDSWELHMLRPPDTPLVDPVLHHRLPLRPIPRPPIHPRRWSSRAPAELPRAFSSSPSHALHALGILLSIPLIIIIIINLFSYIIKAVLRADACEIIKNAQEQVLNINIHAFNF